MRAAVVEVVEVEAGSEAGGTMGSVKVVTVAFSDVVGRAAGTDATDA